MVTRVTFKTAIAVALLAASACTVHKGDDGPDPFGPSDFALSIGLTANPDSITQDGASQSSIVVTAHDATGAPKAGVVIRLDTEVNGEIMDFGRLSARTVVTGTDGRATAIFTAPPVDPLAGGFGRFVTIVATPSGSNTQALNFRTTEIRLIPPGVILPPATTPTPNFTNSQPVNFNVPVTFDASSSCAGELDAFGQCFSSDTITSYAWNFGDGSTASGRVVTHAFSGGSAFNVTLTVTNSRGLSASITRPIAVSAPPSPTGDFVYSPAQPAVNQTIFFNAGTIQPASGRTISRYEWNFGDGTTSSGAQVSKAYSVAANYVVVLTLTDDAGNQFVRQQTISVGTGNPTASFTATVQNATTHTMQYDGSASTAQGGATIVSYAWTFGDGTSGTGQVVSRTYVAAGDYPVRLTVTDSLGRSGSQQQTITVP